MQTGRHFVYVLIERALESDWSKALSEVGGVRGEMKERGRGFTYTIIKNLNGVPVLYPRVLFFLHGTVCSLCSISQCKILYWERVYLQDVAESNFWDSNLFPSGSVNIQYRHCSWSFPVCYNHLSTLGRRKHFHQLQTSKNLYSNKDQF